MRQAKGRVLVPGRTRFRQVLYVVLALLVAGSLAAGTAVLLRGDSRAGLSAAPGGAGRTPGPVEPPLALPTPVLAALNGADAGIPATPAGLAKALAARLRDRRLGPAVAAEVLDLATGEVLYDRGGSRLVVPASTTKITTAAAVLAAFPADHRFATRVVAGTTPGEVVLVGGGDLTLSDAPPGRSTWYAGAARLADLAAAVRAKGVRVSRVTIDGSLFTGPRLAPGWDPLDVAGGYTTPITAVMLDAGRRPGMLARSMQPDLDAGRAFGAALGVPKVPVRRGPAAATGQVLAEVRSAPLARIVEQALLASDNVLAEMLARQVALSTGQPASFAGAAAAVRSVLAGYGVPAAGLKLVDGSGLSRADRLSPDVLLAVLRAAASDRGTRLRPLFAALPVAGYDGTLDNRYRSGVTTAGAGDVRAKTGTLAGVSSLAGLVRTADGRLLAFAFLADRVPSVRAAEAAWDVAASTLARCGC
ncbi:MAG TPA: D-alanyl-D-alanine carboxypeptidase/D-alanyl-D-alanine-endopeptidase [Mycobacteriales bacterium]|nr:D-alanyl-D-alanine carboxypeptidase/D-alanyl-D-alanine-endopeptidase [Mycobacteriales bacterium]